jgi:hypothetical protein
MQGRREVYRLATGYELTPAAREAAAARLEQFDRQLAATGRLSVSRAIRPARRWIGRKKARLFWRKHAFSEPPNEVRRLLDETLHEERRLHRPRARAL